MYDAAVDPYCYPGTAVLINRLDIRDPNELQAFEDEITRERAAEPLPAGRLSVSHLKSVHHHLFQDVYDWAGRVRTIRISKGDSMFCYPENIQAELAKLFDWLRAAVSSRKEPHGLCGGCCPFSCRTQRHTRVSRR